VDCTVVRGWPAADALDAALAAGRLTASVFSPGGAAAGTTRYLNEWRTVDPTHATRELRRQRQMVQVTLWCPSPASRDAAGALVDGTLAATTFLPLPGGEAARLTYAGTVSDDRPQKMAMYRRDLRYMLEYPTTQTAAFPAATSETTNVSRPDGTAIVSVTKP
jgi:hypothetical protein